MTPHDPISAVTHPDPYPYYANLVARTPLYRDEKLGLWIAAGAAAVTAVLTNNCCRVRPPAEPAPAALLGSPAGDIFRRLVRMNDGPGHGPLKRAIAATLGGIYPTQAAEQSSAWARSLANQLVRDEPASVSEFAFQLPVYVVASLLGISRDHLRQTTLWIGDVVRCFAPGSSPEQIGRGGEAASGLIDLCHSFLTARRTGGAEGLLATLAREAKRVGCDDPDVIVANSIGFLFQTYEATAGLIGNTLVALAVQRATRDHVMVDPSLLRDVILDVLRDDPPIQNTRRFLARDGVVAGQDMTMGESVLVVLAAANRDPLANPSPHHVDIRRRDRRTFTFGHGVHACPGETLAITIAHAGIAQALASDIDLAQLAGQVTYRDSVNARIPLFTRAATT